MRLGKHFSRPEFRRGPVSYTHLDVYKRQIPARFRLGDALGYALYPARVQAGRCAWVSASPGQSSDWERRLGKRFSRPEFRLRDALG
ncbi:hypothetical protein [Erwinia amylovora]